MKKIKWVIIGLIALSSVNLVSAHIDWNCAEWDALQTGSITWTYEHSTPNVNYPDVDERATISCATDKGISPDKECLHFYGTDSPPYKHNWATLTSCLIDTSGLNTISVWFQASTANGGDGHCDDYAYLRLLDSSDNIIKSTTLVNFHHDQCIIYSDCSNVSQYDGGTWYCNHINVSDVGESAIKIQLYIEARSTYHRVWHHMYVDLLRFNEPCNSLGPGEHNHWVVLYDTSGNLIDNAQVAIYDRNTHNYAQHWKTCSDGVFDILSGTNPGDSTLVSVKTFDGVFTSNVVVGDNEITNITIPIRYNIAVQPVDENNAPLHGVFVGVLEYAISDPQAWWGYDTYWGRVPITNCSGFYRCDLIAEKGGYQRYNATGLNWTQKSAMVKDYKHTIVMEKEL